MFKIASMVMPALVLVGCGKKTESNKEEKADPATAPSKPEAPAAAASGDAPVTLKLDAIGVTATVPAGSRPQPFNKAIRISGPSATVDVEVADEKFPKTAAELQESQKVLGSDFQPSTLPDGWALRYKSGSSYLLTVVRDIGGKRITCGSNASTPERIDVAMDVCKSLAP